MEWVPSGNAGEVSSYQSAEETNKGTVSGTGRKDVRWDKIRVIHEGFNFVQRIIQVTEILSNRVIECFVYFLILFIYSVQSRDGRLKFLHQILLISRCPEENSKSKGVVGDDGNMSGCSFVKVIMKHTDDVGR